jgi:hypothetical protein
VAFQRIAEAGQGLSGAGDGLDRNVMCAVAEMHTECYYFLKTPLGWRASLLRK